MNLTKGKIAKLYSKKRQSKKKYNKKRYRKNRTLRKTRGFNLAKRTLKHVKRGGATGPLAPVTRTNITAPDILEGTGQLEDPLRSSSSQVEEQEQEQEQEQQQSSSSSSVFSPVEDELKKPKDIINNHPELLQNDSQRDSVFNEYEPPSYVPPKKQEEAIEETTNAAQLPESGHQEEQTQVANRRIEDIGPHDFCVARCNQRDVVDKDACLKKCDEEQQAQSGVVAQKLQQVENEQLPVVASDDSLPQATEVSDNGVSSVGQTPSVVDPVVVEQTTVPDVVVPVKVEQTADVVKESVVLPSAPPLPLPLSSTPPPEEKDKLSQAIDTIVDHLSTKIAERINLPQGASSSGQQNGFTAINEAALNAKGGRKPSRRLINRRRRNKSHKKKKH
jgi:hypothetical protein